MRKDARKHPPHLIQYTPIASPPPAIIWLTNVFLWNFVYVCCTKWPSSPTLPAAIHSFISDLYSCLFPGPARTFGTFVLFCFGWITRWWRDFYPYATHNDTADLNDVSFVIFEPKPKTNSPIVPYPHSFAPWFLLFVFFCFFVFVCLLFLGCVCSHMCFFIACPWILTSPLISYSFTYSRISPLFCSNLFLGLSDTLIALLLSVLISHLPPQVLKKWRKDKCQSDTRAISHHTILIPISPIFFKAFSLHLTLSCHHFPPIIHHHHHHHRHHHRHPCNHHPLMAQLFLFASSFC